LVSAGRFAPFTDHRVQAYMRKSLTRLGVELVEQTSVVEAQRERLLCRDHAPIPFDLCVWAGGLRAHPLAQQARLAVNARGQVLVDPVLRSLSHPKLWVVGDAAQPGQPTGAPPRMSLFFALVTGAHAADSISRVLRGLPPRTLGFSTYGQGIALGRRDAVGYATFPNDRRSGPLVAGRLGLGVRNFFVAPNS
jgi:NADH dehydrogenase FAD-containing subunit